MKSTLIYSAFGAALLTSCSSEPAAPALPELPTTPAAAHSAAPAPRYVALPGQAAVAVNSDVDAAFDQQVAAYAGQTPAVQVPTAPTAPTVDITTPAAPAADVTATEAPATTEPQTPAAAPAPAADITAAPMGGSMNYKVRITNDTPGRVFVEAQDASGTIYPCGFMEGGRTFTTPMENAAPIKGPITVVVRDPDQPGAPEIRRYKVDPPTGNYDGKSVGVNILSGGRYMASVDGQVYFCTPAPEEPAPQPNQPAAPEPAAPAPETPAATTAPAPANPAPTPTPTPAA